MRKFFLVFLFLGIFILGGCLPKDNNKIKVYTSVYPIYDFTSKIGGDKVAVYPVVDFGVEPHHYEPDAATIVKLKNADLFIYNGLKMEYWLDKIKSQLPENKPKLVCATDGVQKRYGHNHYHHDDNEHNHHNEEGIDPHAWLNPLNVITMMENIKNALVEIDPENADYYNANFQHYSEKLNELDTRYYNQINRFDANIRKIIVSHDAFGYLCERYGIEQWAIEGLSRDTEPDMSKIANTIEYAKNNNIGVIFYEKSTGPSVANAIAKDLKELIGNNVIVLELNPIEAISKKERKDGIDYFKIMEQNLANLVHSFNITENLTNQKSVK